MLSSQCDYDSVCIAIMYVLGHQSIRDLFLVTVGGTVLRIGSYTD